MWGHHLCQLVSVSACLRMHADHFMSRQQLWNAWWWYIPMKTPPLHPMFIGCATRWRLPVVWAKTRDFRHTFFHSFMRSDSAGPSSSKLSFSHAFRQIVLTALMKFLVWLFSLIFHFNVHAGLNAQFFFSDFYNTFLQVPSPWKWDSMQNVLYLMSSHGVYTKQNNLKCYILVPMQCTPSRFYKIPSTIALNYGTPGRCDMMFETGKLQPTGETYYSHRTEHELHTVKASHWASAPELHLLYGSVCRRVQSEDTYTITRQHDV